VRRSWPIAPSIRSFSSSRAETRAFIALNASIARLRSPGPRGSTTGGDSRPPKLSAPSARSRSGRTIRAAIQQGRAEHDEVKDQGRGTEAEGEPRVGRRGGEAGVQPFAWGEVGGEEPASGRRVRAAGRKRRRTSTARTPAEARESARRASIRVRGPPSAADRAGRFDRNRAPRRDESSSTAERNSGAPGGGRRRFRRIARDRRALVLGEASFCRSLSTKAKLASWATSRAAPISKAIWPIRLRGTSRLTAAGPRRRAGSRRPTPS
jgi:hypothetical protein